MEKTNVLLLLDLERILKLKNLSNKGNDFSLESKDNLVKLLFLTLSLAQLIIECRDVVEKLVEVLLQLVDDLVVKPVVLLEMLDSVVELLNLLLVLLASLSELVLQLIDGCVGLVALTCKGSNLALKVLLVLLEGFDENGLLVEVGIQSSEFLCSVSKEGSN